MSLMWIFLLLLLIFITDIVVKSISTFLPDHNHHIEEDKMTDTTKNEEKDIQPSESRHSQQQQQQHTNQSNNEKENTKENKQNYHHTATIIFQPIPLIALVKISSFLPKNDCINCMSVCTTFYLVFFTRIYNRVSFSTINQIYTFLTIIERATQLRKKLIMAMTASVDDTTVDNIIFSNDTTTDKSTYMNKCIINKTTAIFSSLTTSIVFEDQVHSWTIANDLQQLFNFCKPNIQALELSWWQLYVFLMTDADYNYNAAKQLYSLQYLFVRRISDFEAMGIASTYRYRDVLLTINNTISEGITNLNNEDSNINDTAVRVAITKAMYKVPEMSDLLQFTPNLTNLILCYEKDKRDSNTTRTTNKLTEYDFEAIHTYCPQLENMTLKGIELHLAKESAITSPEQYRSFIHRLCPVAAKMRKLSLLKVTFASTQQHHNALLCLYLLYKYSHATTIFIQSPCIDETIHNKQEQREEDPISTGYQYYRQIRSFYITHFEHFSFQSSTENAFVFCKQLITEISNYGKSLTHLKMMGFKKRSGGRKKRTKVRPISVDMGWIQKVCPNLQDLILIYASIHNLSDNTIIFKPYSDRIYEDVPFVYTYLHRDSISSSWSIQEFTPETKIIETT